MLSVIAKFETTLAAAITSSATTATISSAATGDGSTVPNGTYGFVIDEGNSSEEFIIATVSGTSLTSILRGISYEDGATEISGNKKSHRKGASIKITDHPALRQVLNFLNGSSTMANVLKCSSAPSANADLANKQYVDGVAIAGGADASTTVKGITKLSTAPASATEPIAVGDNDPRVPTGDENNALAGTSGTPSSTNKFVTNDDTDEDATASKVVRRDSNGHITLPASDPITDNQAARKAYVDNKGLTYISSDLSSSQNPTISVPAGAKIAIVNVSCKSASGDTIPHYGEIFITKTGKTSGLVCPVNQPSSGTGSPRQMSASWSGDNITIAGQTATSPETTIYFYS